MTVFRDLTDQFSWSFLPTFFLAAEKFRGTCGASVLSEHLYRNVFDEFVEFIKREVFTLDEHLKT